MKDEHCQSNVTQRDCDVRHRGVTRWLNTMVIVMAATLSSAGAAYMSARGAVQGVAVHKASQEEVNKRVLDSLKRIEVDVRILRNGHGHK